VGEIVEDYWQPKTVRLSATSHSTGAYVLRLRLKSSSMSSTVGRRRSPRSNGGLSALSKRHRGCPPMRRRFTGFEGLRRRTTPGTGWRCSR
jgi:hypothetical protein